MYPEKVHEIPGEIITDTINHGIGKMYAIYGQTKYILRDKALDIKVKRLCYKQLIRPTVIYGRPAHKNMEKYGVSLERDGVIEAKHEQRKACI